MRSWEGSRGDCHACQGGRRQDQKNVGVKGHGVSALFHALVNVQKEEGIPTRNRQKKHEFPDHLQPVINQLVTERLFRTEGEGEDATISISHEKLFDAWPALKEYVGTKNKELVDRTLLDSRAKKWAGWANPHSVDWPPGGNTMIF